jgi:hypothetical protein
MRLREQGWDIQPTVRKLLRAGDGGSLPAETKGTHEVEVRCHTFVLVKKRGAFVARGMKGARAISENLKAPANLVA